MAQVPALATYQATVEVIVCGMSLSKQEISEVRKSAKLFASSTFEVLQKDYVLPPSAFQRHLKVGKDFYGPEIMDLPAYEKLEILLNKHYAEKFHNDHSRNEIQFASMYLFRFIERCISEIDWAAPPACIDLALEVVIDEFLEGLARGTFTLIHFRLITHIISKTNSQIEFGNLTITPFSQSSRFGTPIAYVSSKIKDAQASFDGGESGSLPGNYSILEWKKEDVLYSTRNDPMLETGEIDRFILGARLILHATIRNCWEVVGSETPISPFSTRAEVFEPRSIIGYFVNRTGSIDSEDTIRFQTLLELLDLIDLKEKSKYQTSFHLAVQRFSKTFSDENSVDNIVDLAIALEALLLGGEKSEEISLKIRSRAATLLSCEDDPAEKIFSDLKILYDIRSSFVHGSPIKDTDLIRDSTKVTNYSGNVGSNIHLFLAVDRFRDLVRRAILARLALALSPDNLWPLNSKSVSIDSALSDDGKRILWRNSWREYLIDRGLGHAINPSVTAKLFLED